jgi:nucleoid-associated protein YgaU
MRKDVKFGLTIGAVLFGTLAVYVIVLSRGAGQPGKTDDAGKSVADVSGSDATSATPGQTSTDTAGTATPTPDHPAVDTTVTPTETPPATQPTASADQKFDWNDALTHGQTSLFASAEPQRTVTPQSDATAAHDGAVVNPFAPPPLIDTSAATQPTALADPIVPPTPATPSASDAVPRTHVIESGESLWTISAAVYGDGKYCTKIIAANPKLDPKHLKVGAVLVIPALSTDQRSAVADRASSVSTRSQTLDPATEYRVIPGDSLEQIARKLYDDAKMQEKLYETNKTLIGPDENRLKVGWVLKLPSPPTVAPTVAR